MVMISFEFILLNCGRNASLSLLAFILFASISSAAICASLSSLARFARSWAYFLFALRGFFLDFSLFYCSMPFPFD